MTAGKFSIFILPIVQKTTDILIGMLISLLIVSDWPTINMSAIQFVYVAMTISVMIAKVEIYYLALLTQVFVKIPFPY